MISMLYTLLFVVSIFGLGNTCFKLFKISFEEDVIENYILSSTFGLAILAYMVLFIGYAGLLYGWFLRCLLIIIFIVTLPATIKYIKRGVKGIRFITYFKNANLFYKIILILFFIFLLLAFIRTFVPSTGWDVAMYHYAMPKIWLQNHTIANNLICQGSFNVGIIHSIFVFCLGVCGEVFANQSAWLIGILTMGTIYLIGKEVSSKNTGLLAAVIFVSTPRVLMQLSDGWVDLSVVLFFFSSVYLLMLWVRTQDSKWFLIAAVFTGVSAAVKHIGIIANSLLVVPISYFLWRQYAQKNMCIHALTYAKHFAFFCCIAVTCMLPFMIQRFIDSGGNPFYPFLSSIFTARYIPNIGADFFTAASKVGTGLWSFLTYPWLYFTDISSTWGDWSSTTGPLYLAFVPLIILLKPDKNVYKIHMLSYIAFSYFLVAYFLFPGAVRYVFPSLGILAVLSGAMISTVYDRVMIKRWCMAFAVLFTLAVMLSIVMVKFVSRIAFLTGRESRQEFLLRVVENYPVINYANMHLKSDDFVFLMDTQGYRLNRQYLIGYPYSHSVKLPKWEISATSDYMNALKNLNVTHMIMATKYGFIKKGMIVYAIIQAASYYAETNLSYKQILSNLPHNYTEKDINQLVNTDIKDHARISDHGIAIKQSFTKLQNNQEYHMARHMHAMQPYLKEMFSHGDEVLYRIDYTALD